MLVSLTRSEYEQLHKTNFNEDKLMPAIRIKVVNGYGQNAQTGVGKTTDDGDCESSFFRDDYGIEHRNAYVMTDTKVQLSAEDADVAWEQLSFWHQV